MNADQAARLRPAQRVVWTLRDLPVATVVDLRPANPFPPTVKRGRLVRIAWKNLSADQPNADALAWTDDLLLVGVK